MSDGQLLGGRYRRERMIGAGAMGQVWLAEDTLLNRVVAIKNVAPATVMSGLNTPMQGDLLDRVAREARLAARMSHPNAVAVYDLVTVDGQPHVVMEYVAGVTLADEIRSRGTLPPDRVAALGAALSDALADAHDIGIVHRDIKPANILIDRRSQPKLADFGIARASGDGTATGAMLGTPAFVAPEVARGDSATSASDVWSLGITLYCALEGRSPFQSGPDDTPMAVLARVLSTTPTPPAHGGVLTPVVMRMLAGDPRYRPDAAEVATRLRTAAAGGPVHPAGVGFEKADVASDATTRLEPAPAATTKRPTPAPVPSFAAAAPMLPPVPPTPHRGGSRAWPWVVAASVAVVAVIAAVMVTMGLRQDTSTSSAVAQVSTPIARPSSSSTPPSSNPAATVTLPPQVRTETRTVAAAAEPSTTAPDTVTADGLYSYDGSVNSLQVPGPDGLEVDPATDTANYRDYVAGSGDERSSNAYLRVGVGNPKALASFDREVGDSVRFLRKHYGDADVQEPRYVEYCGTQAADIEFTGDNDDGVRRHAVERIWHSAGQTLIVQLNVPADEWESWSGYLTPMFSTCVTG